LTRPAEECAQLSQAHRANLRGAYRPHLDRSGSRGDHRAAPSFRAFKLGKQRERAKRIAQGFQAGAEKRTRTSTVLPPPGPEPGASTNSAISAREGAECNGKALLCQRNSRSPEPNFPMKSNKKTDSPRSKKTSAPARSTDVRNNDPHLEREQSRYEHPLPSREYVLQVLLEQGVPVAEDRLAQLLGVAQHEMDAFVRRLAAMERS